MPVAEIITIGTELLLGEIQDTNTRYIARLLKDNGVNLYRTMTVGDNAGRIAAAIREALQRADIVITTGGLGPTVDDPTREAVALAFGVATEFREELWEQIQARFKRYGRLGTENNRRQAYVPQGSLAIENPVGTAPAFRVETGEKVVISLPGVPREMEHLMIHTVLPYLKEHYHLRGTIKACVLHTAGMGESLVDELVGDLETIGNPTVGLLAHPGQVDVRVTAQANSVEEADRLILEMVTEIRKRLGENIYGVDEQTLEGVLLEALSRHGWSLAVVESGLNGEIIHRIASLGHSPAQVIGEVINEPLDAESLKRRTLAYRASRGAEVALGAALLPGKEKQDLHLVLATPQGVTTTSRSYGGPPQLGPLWAVSSGLDIVRRSLADS